jgi:hypothetical protein
MLTIPKSKAAIINSEGIVEVENEIIQYTDGGIKVINDGDRSKISMLTSITESSDEITVYETKNMMEKGERRLSFSGSQVHPHPLYGHYFQILYVNYFDLNYVDGIVYYCAMGTEVASLFQGQVNNVSVLNLHSYNAGIYAPNLGVSFYEGNSEHTYASNTWSNYTNIRFSLTGTRKAFAHIYDFNIKTHFEVVYANGVYFYGTIG